MTTLGGKTAFVTGGASGIGFALAEALIRAGSHVVIADVEAGALERARGMLEGKGTRVTTAVLDVTDRAAFARARDQAIAAHGAVHLLFNNAGVNAAGPVHTLTWKDWDWVMGVNLGGVINGVQTFLPELLRHGAEAHLINTASVGGLVGMKNLAIYNAAKFGVVGLSEALRADLKPSRVNVSVLCPGIVTTALTTSDRNRPAHLRNAAAPAPVAAGAPADVAAPNPVAMSADELAAFVVAAITANRFWIVSHPEFMPLIEQREQSILASFQGEPDPERVQAMRALIEPF
jgi:NAD(P)-dependent dehydrogenase (short-subunit alcohol dehydrogenase family)